jgi:transmembrane sensor
MNRERIVYLYQSYLDNTSTPDELQELESVLNNPEHEEILKEIVDKSYFNISKEQIHDMSDSPAREKSFSHIVTQVQNKKPLKLWPRITAAASVLLMLSIGGYFLLHKKQPSGQIAQNQIHDIAPGSNKAVLTLANGKVITLTGARNGNLAVQGYTAINKTADGKVMYNADQASPASEKVANEVVYNTLTTPRGGQYHLVLADGTNVWLDAASSITYPVAFIGKDRPVETTGQVYFEVAHNAAKPFKVTANGQTVEVLGTHFNINAYPDEPAIKTTLFEGSIKLTSSTGHAILKPGQQAQINQGRINIVNDANMDEAIAWHKGLFEFHDADIQTVMRQLSRWYNVDISYEGKITDRHFSGKLYRNVTALTVADILSYKKIHFRIEGKQIVVEQ